MVHEVACELVWHTTLKWVLDVLPQVVSNEPVVCRKVNLFMQQLRYTVVQNGLQ